MSAATTDANVKRAAQLDTSTLSDALDRLGIMGQCRYITPRFPQAQLSGRAYTILYGPAGKPAGTVGDYVDDVPPGDIIVLDNGGREDVTVWGDILSEIAHLRGVGGTVIDGICRDVGLCVDLGYAIFSRGQWMRTGKDRVQVEMVNQPVTLGEARVAPGDLLRGDADGVLVIPRAHEAQVLDVAEEIGAAEENIRSAIRQGMTLTEARRQFRYHSLQTVKA